jgi:hypothetical protein
MAFALVGSTITQTGTDATFPTTSGNGFTVTTANGINTVSFGTNTLVIQGTCTVAYNQVLTNTSGGGIEIQAGGTLTFNGDQTVNSVTQPVGGVLANIVSSTITSPDGAIRLTSTNVNSQARLVIRNCEIRVNSSGWASISANTNGWNTIRTEGDFAFIQADLSLTGTNKKRVRINSANPVLDLQATNTRSGMWFNFGAAQTSVKGYTPLNVDGPEINVASLTTANQVVLDNYNVAGVVGSYYTGSQIVLYGGAWCKLKNFSRGTNITWWGTNSTATANNVLEFSTDLRFEMKDVTGSGISGAKVYVPANTNSITFRPLGQTSATRSQATLNLTADGTGVSTAEYVYAMNVNSNGVAANINANTSTYFCPTTTVGAEATTYKIRKYEYFGTSGSIVLASSSQVVKTAVLSSDTAITMTEATAAALTGITITKATGTPSVSNPHTITVTASANRTLDEIYCYWKQWFCLFANFDIDDTLTKSGTRLILGNYKIVMA